MKESDPSAPTPPSLRSHAEEVLRQKAPPPEELAALSPEAARHTLHELRVHQIELEMQNEELRRAQVELDAARAHYFDLYDLAPVGYVTLGEQGMIRSANLTAATLLGVHRGALLDQPFSRFILKEDEDIWYLHRKKLFETGQPQTCELRLLKKGGGRLWAHLAANTAPDDHGSPMCRLVLNDLTERKRAEQSRARLAAIVEFSADAIISKDLDSLITSWNSGAEKMFGYTAHEMVGTPITRLIPSDRQAEEQQILEQIRCGGSVNHFDTVRLTKDGRLIPVSLTVSPIKDAAGNILGVSKAARDITERKQAEQKLLRHQQRLELAQRSAGAGLWDWDIVTGQIDWSRELFGLFGLDPDRTAPGFEAWRQAIHPQDQAAAASRIEQAVKDRTQLDNEYRVVLRGERIRWIHALGNTVYGPDQRPLRMSGICLDITERKAAEAELARIARQWQDTFDASNDAIWILDQDHRVLRSNKAAERLFQHPCNEMLGEHCFAVAHGSAEPPANCPFERARSTGHREAREIEQGAQVLSVVVDPILDAVGRFAGAVHVVSDITEKKQMEANVLRMQRMEGIGSLAGGIAHDLNNILAPVLLAAPFLREEKDERERSKLIDMVESCAQRGANIIQQLLTFARGRPGARAPIPVRLLLNEMGRLIRETFPRNLELHLDSAKDIWPVIGDATQFHQALMNLCVNARDAMPGGGTLTLGAGNVTVVEGFATTVLEARPGPCVCVTVADTGTGIPPENLHRIFDPFFTTKEIGKGSGLGLATLLGIMRGHEGFIRVVTEPGRGTTFELYFPARPEARATTTPKPEAPAANGRGELILIVDDEPAISRVVQLTLTKHGYRVVAAREGREALAVFGGQSAEIKAVITDMMMPGTDGPALVRALRQLNPQLPILGMTGLAERVDVEKLEALNLAEVLHKPFPGAVLLTALHRVLGGGSGGDGAIDPAAPAQSTSTPSSE